MKWFKRKTKRFASRTYDLNLVVDLDEYEFLMNMFGLFQDLDYIEELNTVKAHNKAVIIVETNHRVLIKILTKEFGFMPEIKKIKKEMNKS